MQTTKTYKMETGTAVYTKTKGAGVVISVNGSTAIVDFNGATSNMMISLLSLKPFAARKTAHTMSRAEPTVLRANSIQFAIVGDRASRSSIWSSSAPFTSIMAKADELGHFASDIIEAAYNGKAVSEKQAWAVAMFAKENGFCS